MLESSTRKLSTFPLTTIVASPCAAVVIGVGSFPPFRTAMYVSGNDVSPTSSLQLPTATSVARSEEHTSELQSRSDLVCRLLLEKKKSGPESLAATGVAQEDVAPTRFHFFGP